MRKILLISWSDLFGGAAQATNEIYKSLKKEKNINFFVQNKISSDKSISTYKNKTINFILRKYLSILFYKLRFSKNDYSYNIINSDIVQKAKLDNYDVINIHWVNSETLSIFDISKLNKNLVITLHDMWFMNGSEHYLYNLPCYYYKSGKNIKPNKIDILIWRLKKKFLEKKNVIIVAPSKWMAKLAKKSRIFSNFPIKIIPYPVDKNIFYPQKVQKLKANNQLIIKQKNTIDVLFVSAGGLFNFRKGFDLLDNAISRFDKEKKFRIIIVGSYRTKDLKTTKSKIINLGEIKNKNLLNKIYNFADILTIPSRLDNLPNVALEAQSCGLPIVSYNVGGLADIIDHKKNGFLVKPFNIKNFYYGIEYCYENRKKFYVNALIKSRKWSQKKVSKKYPKKFKKL